MKTAIKASLILFVLAVAGALATAFYLRESRARRRAAWEALDQARRTGAAVVQATIERHAQVLSETAACAAPALELSNTVLRVLGRGLENRAATPPPPPPRTPPVATAVTPATPAVPKPATPDDDEVPFGGPSREELERRHREQEQPPAPAPHIATETPVAPRAVPRPAAPEPEPPMVLAARAAVQDAAAAAGIAFAADEVMKMVAPLRMRMEQSANPDDILKLAQRMDQHRVTLDELRVRATDAGAGISRAREQVAAEVRRIERERAEAAQAEAARRAETARQALMAEEKARAEMTRQRLAPLIKQYRFDEIVAQLDSALPGYQTETGRAPLAHWRERVQRVADLRAFLIAQAGKEPYRWGWTDPYGARDILAITADGVKLAGKPPVPWADVPLPQTLKMLDHYAARPGVATRTQGGLFLAAAILCEEWGDRLRALDYRRKTLDVASYLAGDLERLLPDLK